MSEQPELKPCRFCGHKVAPTLTVESGWGIAWVICRKKKGGCGAQSGRKNSREDAVTSWNQSANVVCSATRQDAEITRLREQRAKWRELYDAVNQMMARIGADGTMSARSDSCARVMDALHAIDGGVVSAEIEAEG
jgi:hypothetical protein